MIPRTIFAPEHGRFATPCGASSRRKSCRTTPTGKTKASATARDLAQGGRGRPPCAAWCSRNTAPGRGLPHGAVVVEELARAVASADLASPCTPTWSPPTSRTSATRAEEGASCRHGRRRDHRGARHHRACCRQRRARRGTTVRREGRFLVINGQKTTSPTASSRMSCWCARATRRARASHQPGAGGNRPPGLRARGKRPQEAGHEGAGHLGTVLRQRQVLSRQPAGRGTGAFRYLTRNLHERPCAGGEKRGGRRGDHQADRRRHRAAQGLRPTGEIPEHPAFKLAEAELKPPPPCGPRVRRPSDPSCRWPWPARPGRRPRRCWPPNSTARVVDECLQLQTAAGATCGSTRCAALRGCTHRQDRRGAIEVMKPRSSRATCSRAGGGKRKTA